jgi:hypothetical protein
MTSLVEMLFQFVFEIFLTYTGEIALFLITFGKHKPRWDLYGDQKISHFLVFSEASMWLGLAFWIVVIQVPYSCFK